MSKASALLLIPGVLILFFSLLAEGSGWAALGVLLVGSALFIESHARKALHLRLSALEQQLQDERAKRLGGGRANAARTAAAVAPPQTATGGTAGSPTTVDTPAMAAARSAVPPAPPALKPSPQVVSPAAADRVAPAVAADVSLRPSPLVVTAANVSTPAAFTGDSAAVKPSPDAAKEGPAVSIAAKEAPRPANVVSAAAAVTPAQAVAVSAPPRTEQQPSKAAAEIVVPAATPTPAMHPPLVPAIAAESRSASAKTETPRPPQAPVAPRTPPRPVTPSVQPAAPRRSLLDLEQTLGVNWLSKLGVAILVIGVSFFLAWQLRQLGPLGKDIVGASAALALLGGGIWGEKSERYRILARAVLAGGWALLFFVSYATYHVTAARVIESPLGALVLMMTVAAAMVVHTLRYRSQVLTGLAFALTFTTIAINRADAASLSANVILAIGFSVVVVRMRWFELELVGILATYANHFLWLRPIIEPMHGKVHPFPQFTTSAAILILYWAVFRVAFVVRRPPDERTSALAGMLNTALLLVLMKYQAVRPDLTFWMLVLLGALEIILSRLPIMRQKRTSFIVLTVVGTALIAAAIPFRLAPSYVTPAWLIDAIVFSAAGILTSERVYRRLGTAIAAATTIQLLWFPAARLAAARFHGAPAAHEWVLGSICLGVMLVLYAESVLLPRRWPELFNGRVDQWVAHILGYSGAGVAVLAGWVFFPGSGAAVFWAVLAMLLIIVRKSLALAHEDLAIHSILIAIAAMLRAVTVNLPSDEVLNGSPHVTWRLVTVAAVAIVFYGLSRLTLSSSAGAEFVSRIGGTIGGTALLMLLAWYELPALHVGAAWTILAFLLAVVGRRFDAPYVAIHANAVAALAIGRVVVINLPSGDVAAAQPLYLTWRFVTVVLLAAVLYLLARWNPAGALTIDPPFLAVPLWSATTLLVVLQWYEFKAPAVAVAWTLSAVALAIAGRRVQRFHLTLQANVLAAATVFRVAIVNLVADDLLVHRPIHITWRLLAVTLLAGALYLLARWNATGVLEHQRLPMIAPLWAAAGLLTLLPWFELQPQAVVLTWTALAITFAAIGHRFRLSHLVAQANFIATVAVVKVVAIDMASGATIVDHPVRLTWRAAGVIALAALLYTLARWNVRASAEPQRSFAVVPRAVATSLLMLLMWSELQSVAVVVVWSAIGLALLIIGQRFRIADVALQANGVAIAAIVAAIVVNLPSSATAFAHVSWRLLAVAAAAALLYSLSRWNSLGDAVREWLREQEFSEVAAERIYSAAPMWTATALLSLLAWYQLLAASVALAWTILGLLLLEIGFRRASRELLAQAYLLLFVVVGRVLVVNMNIDDGGTIGARAYTIVPIVAALLYAYGRTEAADEQRIPRWLAPAFAWMATLCAAALLRFELSADAVVVGWAAVATATVAAAFLTRRLVFSQIGIVVALAALARGIVHNLYERSYFPPPGPFNRWIYIGAAVALLVGSLPFAFRTRSFDAPVDTRPIRRVTHWLNARPEQILFFIPLALVTMLIGTEMRSGMLTVSWGIEAVVVLVFAFWIGERSYRLSGIALLLLCIGKIFLFDFWSLNLRDKALTGIIMGLALIGISLLYTRKREAILQFL